MRVQTSSLEGWSRGDRKQCTNVHAQYFAAKNVGEKRKCQRVLKKATICQKNCCLDKKSQSTALFRVIDSYL